MNTFEIPTPEEIERKLDVEAEQAVNVTIPKIVARLAQEFNGHNEVSVDVGGISEKARILIADRFKSKGWDVKISGGGQLDGGYWLSFSKRVLIESEYYVM